MNAGMSDRDRVDIARMVIGHANAMSVHSGNIINWSSLKKGLGYKSSEELLCATENAITSWLQSIGVDLISLEAPLSSVDISNTLLLQKVDMDQRDELKVSVKIFLSQWRSELISQAVQKVSESLGVKLLDSVLVSFPMTPLADVGSNNKGMPDFNKVKNVATQRLSGFLEQGLLVIFWFAEQLWNEMELMVDLGAIAHIGVADFDKASMEKLYSWARVKPTIDQISMNDCCTVSADLIEFSKNFDIELLSHNDAPEILSPTVFQALIKDTVQDESSSYWNSTYIARYSVIVRCRGIVKAKGYIVGAERSTIDDVEDFAFF